VSCPDWRGLLAARGRDPGGPGTDPPGWSEALDHLDRCPGCAGEAFALDPLLVFRRLPRPEPRAGEVEALEVEVLALVRAGRRAERLPRRTAWWRGAAAAALAAAALALEPGTGGLRPAPGRAVATLAADLPALPLLDGLEGSSARIYELGGDGLAVVMVVDESLDV